MSLTNSVKEIALLFNREVSLSAALLDIMKSEQKALSDNDLSAFANAISDKHNLLKEIEATEASLALLLKNQGLSFSQEDLRELLSRCDDTDRNILDNVLGEVREIAAQCHEQNLINSKIIETSNNNAQKIMAILRGQTNEQSDLYDISGKSSKNTQTQIFGRV